jgi:hypothetical protein
MRILGHADFQTQALLCASMHQSCVERQRAARQVGQSMALIRRRPRINESYGIGGFAGPQMLMWVAA